VQQRKNVLVYLRRNAKDKNLNLRNVNVLNLSRRNRKQKKKHLLPKLRRMKNSNIRDSRKPRLRFQMLEN
jgi:hypothetical protein